MTDDDDAIEQALDASPEEAREQFQRLVKTEGLDVAYRTAISICKDGKAPAPAKATMVVALMRAAGAFARAEEDPVIEPHAMTPAQLAHEIKSIQAQAKRRARARDGGDGVFE